MFEFATATRIVFGKGSAKTYQESISQTISHPLIITSGSFFESSLVLMIEKKLPVEKQMVLTEPDLQKIEEMVLLAKSSKCDSVIGIGGGSVIDAGKAVAGLVTNPGKITDYLEVVGKNLPLNNLPLPFYAFPTTAGTGSEVTKNAVITVPGDKVKVSLRSPLLFPKAAIVDPELTYGLPPEATANTGMDALTQVLEPFVSTKSNRMTDMFCREGLRRIGQSILAVYDNGSNEQAREDMAWGSLLGGFALANAGLGAVHGFASPIGGMFTAPHGAICARLLAPTIAMNIQSLKDMDSGNPVIQRFAEAGRLLTNDNHSQVDDLIDWLNQVTVHLHILPLRDYGIVDKDLDLIVEKALVTSSMKGNPIKLEPQKLRAILKSAL